MKFSSTGYPFHPCFTIEPSSEVGAGAVDDPLQSVLNSAFGLDDLSSADDSSHPPAVESSIATVTMELDSSVATIESVIPQVRFPPPPTPDTDRRGPTFNFSIILPLIFFH